MHGARGCGLRRENRGFRALRVRGIVRIGSAERERTSKNMKSVIMSMKNENVATLHMVQMLAAKFMKRVAEKSVTKMPCRVFMASCEGRGRGQARERAGAD